MVSDIAVVGRRETPTPGVDERIKSSQVAPLTLFASMSAPCERRKETSGRFEQFVAQINGVQPARRSKRQP